MTDVIHNLKIIHIIIIIIIIIIRDVKYRQSQILFYFVCACVRAQYISAEIGHRQVSHMKI
jgi:hypothetical protein